MAFFSAIWNGLRTLGGLLMPMFAGVGSLRMGPALKWTLHILLLSLIIALLIFINVYFELDSWWKGSGAARYLANVWVALIFLLVYALGWLGWLLWQLLGLEDVGSEFPDIDSAWDEGVRALGEQGIDITEVPLFLMLGRPAGSEHALFNASQLKLNIKGVPQRSDAPLHIFGNHDGVYVTCAGASLLGRQAEIVNGGADGPAPAGAAMDSHQDEEDDEFKTLGADQGGRARDIQNILARAREQGRSQLELTEAEKREIDQILAEESQEQASQSTRPRPALLKNVAETDLLSARLEHVCKLINRDRRPFCSINGVMMLVPYHGTDTDEDANQTGAICRQDLSIVRQSLKIHCPSFAMFCDVETAPGFDEFISRFPERERQRRVGQRFPLAPEVQPGNVPKLIEGATQWIGNSLFPNWVFKLFRLDGSEETAEITRGNAKLYRLMCEMTDRHKRLGRILSRALATDDGYPPLFGGCYIAGTGAEAARGQAFVPGVFRRLTENQNFVAWSDAAFGEEADYQRWTKMGYLGVLVLVGLCVGLGFFAFWSD